MPYVYSTLSSDQVYTLYHTEEGRIPKIVYKVHVKGGANVASKQLVTPLGVATRITEKQKELLLENRVFKIHVENGFVCLRDDVKEVDIEKIIAEGMETRDASAPLVDADFEEGSAPSKGKKAKG